ncbi:MAG: hypothetical protein ACREUX_00185, partial [Burkholderiales bacterium]
MERPLTEHIHPGRPPLDIEGYERVGGYQSVHKALQQLSPEAVLKEVTDSNLRGRGGAGFPTGQKWSFVPRGDKAPRRKYLVVNADEMEPGTFKDRLLLEGNPHQMIEAVIVSAYAIEASNAYIFVRGEYHLAMQRLEQAVAEAATRGYLGNNILGSPFSLDVHVH